MQSSILKSISVFPSTRIDIFTVAPDAAEMPQFVKGVLVKPLVEIEGVGPGKRSQAVFAVTNENVLG